MNMEESNKKRENLERAKTIMGKIDPALLTEALSEMMIEADEAEEADVAKAKKAIKGIYDSIPEGRDKKSILSKAITELDSDIIEKEVKVIKENLSGIDKETIMNAAKDYGYLSWSFCQYPVHACENHPVELCDICINGVSIQHGLPCHVDICAYPVRHCSACLPSISVKGSPPGYGMCSYSVRLCYASFISPCLNYCIHGIPTIPDPWQLEDPWIMEQLKEEIIQEVLQRPELSRAMKKMLKKIQEEK